MCERVFWNACSSPQASASASLYSKVGFVCEIRYMCERVFWDARSSPQTAAAGSLDPKAGCLFAAQIIFRLYVVAYVCAAGASDWLPRECSDCLQALCLRVHNDSSSSSRVSVRLFAGCACVYVCTLTVRLLAGCACVHVCTLTAARVAGTLSDSLQAVRVCMCVH